MRIKVLLAALAALVLATNVAGSAHAGTQDASPTVASAASDPYRGVVIASGLTPAGRAGVRATEPPSCYTHFAPPYPNGVTSLAHYYRNCNGFALYAFGGFQLTSGTIVSLTPCLYFPDGYWRIWLYQESIGGVTYGTFVC